MMILCPACRRHVRVAPARCPFCAFVLGGICVALVVSCGGRREEVRAVYGGPPSPSFVVELKTDAPHLIPNFVKHAETYGCTVIAQNVNGAGARCPEGVISIDRNGNKVRVTCSSEMSEDGCRTLLDHITHAKPPGEKPVE